MGRKGMVPFVQYVLGRAAMAGGVMYAREGQRWCSILVPIGVGLAIILGFGRLFGVGVKRTPEDLAGRAWDAVSDFLS